jgi:hypothetical protein
MADNTLGTMIGYDFNRDGKYTEKQYLDTHAKVATFIHTTVVQAFMDKREAMITDSGDNAVFHVKAGQVLFAGGADTERFAAYLRTEGRAAGVRATMAQHRDHEGMER